MHFFENKLQRMGHTGQSDLDMHGNGLAGISGVLLALPKSRRRKVNLFERDFFSSHTGSNHEG
jgi:hypothetical protein